jgi:methyl-accepting chemotaxis protein
MGFAVVADEVRNLAQRSAQAAKETAAKIEGAIGKTAQGVEISSKVAAGLAEIVDKARKVDELAAEVATASREQSQGIEQLNSAVTQMDKVTQSNAAGAEESASAARELSAQAGSLKTAVIDLRQLVQGAAAPLPGPARHPAVQQRSRLVSHPAPPAAPSPSAPIPAAGHGGRNRLVAAGEDLAQPGSPSRASHAPALEGGFKDF